jgi:predicted glycogen debranching enzyme
VANDVAVIELGRAVCTDLATAEQREWLVTNGLGSFAAGTVAGLQTRRYHGLLVAALKPPGGRTYLVTKLEESATYDGRTYAFSCNRWGDGTVAPTGYRFLTSFRFAGCVPVWSYAFADAIVEKRVWMEQGAQTTYVSYCVTEGIGAVALSLRALVNYRDFHAATHAGDWQMSIVKVADGVRVLAFDGATPFFVRAPGATCETAHVWYRDFDLSAARARGLDDREDHLHAATFGATLRGGESLTVVASLVETPADHAGGGAALARQRSHEATIFAAFDANAAGHEPDWIRSRALVADQFVVDVPLAPAERAQTVIAGYH